MLKKDFNVMFDKTPKNNNNEKSILCDDSAIKLKKALHNQLIRN